MGKVAIIRALHVLADMENPNLIEGEKMKHSCRGTWLMNGLLFLSILFALSPFVYWTVFEMMRPASEELLRGQAALAYAETLEDDSEEQDKWLQAARESLQRASDQGSEEAFMLLKTSTHWQYVTSAAVTPLDALPAPISITMAVQHTEAAQKDATEALEAQKAQPKKPTMHKTVSPKRPATTAELLATGGW